MLCFYTRVQVLRDMCKQGYRDALHFLKKTGKHLKTKALVLDVRVAEVSLSSAQQKMFCAF